MILTNFAVSKKLVQLLRALHNDFKVKFTVNVISTIACGHPRDILGPILFTFFIAAVMITSKATNNVTAFTFYSKNDAKLTGCSYRAKGEKVLLLDSEYAHDTVILFDNCEDPTNGVNCIVTNFARFRMEGSYRKN